MKLSLIRYHCVASDQQMRMQSCRHWESQSGSLTSGKYLLSLKMLSVQGTNITSPIRKRNQTDLSRIGAGKKPLTLYTNINMGS